MLTQLLCFLPIAYKICSASFRNTRLATHGAPLISLHASFNTRYTRCAKTRLHGDKLRHMRLGNCNSASRM